MGHNFADPIPLDDLPANVEAGGSLAGASLTSKFQTTTMFPGVSSAVLDTYVEYVPRPVPRAPCSVGKRGRADYSSGLSAAKKSHQSSTCPGTQVIGSMLLGEHIYTLLSSCCLFVPLTKYFSPFSDGVVVAMSENEEEEDDDAPLVTCR